MRKLPPSRAIAHAFNSVLNYRKEALRVGSFWIPLLFAIGLVRAVLDNPDPERTSFDAVDGLEVLSTAVGLVAFSSMAVNWHRFILRDEHGSPWRIDNLVLRYAGNSLLVIAMVGIPLLLGVAIAAYVPVTSILMLPLSLLAGTVVTALSIKLPAVALGRTDFSFAMAWESCKDNIWQIFAVFLLNAGVVLGLLLVIVLAMVGAQSISPILAKLVGLIADAAMALFLALFNASVFTSLYGFFVERRDF